MSADKRTPDALLIEEAEYRLTLKALGVTKDDVEDLGIAPPVRGADYEHCSKCNKEYYHIQNSVVIRCPWCRVYIYAAGAQRLYSEKSMRVCLERTRMIR